MGAEKEVFSSKVKYEGVFSFKDFYKFCHAWLLNEKDMEVLESAYSEKIKGDSKDVDVEWKYKKKKTDYFMFKGAVKFKIIGLKNVEVAQGGIKIKTNMGQIEASIKGILERDYDGKFETSAFKKFLRGIYEKWVIPSQISKYENDLATICDDFLGQAKAYLDLEGRR